MVAIALADLTVQVGLRPSGSTRLMPLLAPVMLLGFGAALLLRFLAVYRRAQQQNVVLEARVAEKHAELEENFARLNALERQRAVVAERERLMREMHDGLGGELVAALAVVEGDERAPTAVGDALKHALDEMRLVILSLDPWLRGIPELLGAMRSRLEPRLASHGVRFRWEIRDLPPTPGLGASGSLQVLRVVQEAVSNALQHADARTIALSTGTDDDERHVFVAIRDDGRGFDAAKPGGRGLLNMRERARELGGTLEVESGTSGTCVRLWVPVDGGRDA
jgi:signal transduction histidine kinase